MVELRARIGAPFLGVVNKMPKGGPMADTLTINQLTPHFQDIVTFSATVTSKLKGRLQIQVACYQAGVLVYGSPGWIDENPAFQLGPTQSWQSGAAEGIAALFDQEIVAPFHVKQLAECQFIVQA